MDVNVLMEKRTDASSNGTSRYFVTAAFMGLAWWAAMLLTDAGGSLLEAPVATTSSMVLSSVWVAVFHRRRILQPKNRLLNAYLIPLHGGCVFLLLSDLLVFFGNAGRMAMETEFLWQWPYWGFLTMIFSPHITIPMGFVSQRVMERIEK